MDPQGGNGCQSGKEGGAHSTAESTGTGFTKTALAGQQDYLSASC